MNRRSSCPLIVLLAVSACGAAPEHPAAPPGGVSAPIEPPPIVAPVPPPVVERPIPVLRLPGDTRPTAETIVMTIDPERDGFSGAVDIAVTLDVPRSVVWLHGKGLHVTRATATPEGGAAVPAEWQQQDKTGMTSLTLPQPLPAGHATLHLELNAPFGPKLEGLHKVKEAGAAYAVTQFESIAARDAFPCFDEPGFKIPFDITLVVPRSMQAISNTHEIDRRVEGDSVRVHFAPTVPLPSYLVAFAVGPFDVVTAPDVPPNAVRRRSLPLRGVTARGRGKEIAHALAHTGEILATLERYFGIEYPFDKLDILAVPEKGGAMENAGAVTFAEFFLLFDEKTAPLRQRRAYASVMAHELAHQWVGDLVTAGWWDDLWLNEAFATWLGTKTVDAWNPKFDAATDLLRGVQGAIGEDGLTSARAVRQPITSTNDIENAFDAITYQKGGGVLAMFERWVGPEIFQRGLREYLSQHRFGSGTADDFLDAVSRAAGKDVKTAFHTFLDQPGVPYLEAEVKCDGAPADAAGSTPKPPRLHLKQSRYLPLASPGDTDKQWQVPICARYQVGKEKETKEACMLLTEKEGDLPLGGVCPSWVFPNAGAAGYFRFGLAPADLARLQAAGFAALSGHERVALGNSLRAAYNRGTLPMKNAIEAAAPFASDPHSEVASEPMGLLVQARDWLYGDPLQASVEAYGRELFRGVFHKLGWTPAKGEDGDRTQLRASVLGFLALTARDPAVRSEAKKRALAFLGYPGDGPLHPEAVDANLASIALTVAGEEADRPLWDAIHARLAKTDDAELRGRLLSALISAKSPDLVPLVRELALDPVLRSTEVTAPLSAQFRDPALREAAWRWVKDHFDQLLAAVPKHHGQTPLIHMSATFCDDEHALDIGSFFAPRIAQIEGGVRVMGATVEEVRLCGRRRARQEPSARELFDKHK